MDATAAVNALLDSAALWLVGTGRSEPVIRAACDVIVAGIEGPNLLMLAARSINEDVSSWEFDPLVTRAVAETGRVLPPRNSAGVQLAAARAMAMRTLRGEVSCRQLASWAHLVIGHMGARGLQSLVVLDDEYDLAEYTGRADLVAEVEGMVEAEARRLIALES